MSRREISLHLQFAAKCDELFFSLRLCGKSEGLTDAMVDLSTKVASMTYFCGLGSCGASQGHAFDHRIRA